MKVVTCEFLVGATTPRDFPPAVLPEVVFVGRSNVGKSSLINALIGRKGLARTSSTPGRTRQINFFRVNEDCLFVDLPGYGYAKVAKKVRAAWDELVGSYFSRPAPGMLVIMIVDARHPPFPLDLEMRDWLEEQGLPFRIALTKSDKLSKNQLNKNLKEHHKGFDRPDLSIACSATTREGTAKIWAAIDRMIHETKHA